jgi:polyphosphate kinase 2
MEHMNPRYAHVVALDKPTEQETKEWYWQRYIREFPQAGQIALFDRSWYNRAGVESVMGFCTPQQLDQFYNECPVLETVFVNAGIKITKFWFDINQEEQNKRFNSRQTHPLKVGKMSSIDIASQTRWDDYSHARDVMLEKTNTIECPWIIVDSNNKQQARLAAIQYVLLNNDYLGKDINAIGTIDPLILK